MGHELLVGYSRHNGNPDTKPSSIVTFSDWKGIDQRQYAQYAGLPLSHEWPLPSRSRAGCEATSIH